MQVCMDLSCKDAVRVVLSGRVGPMITVSGMWLGASSMPHPVLAYVPFALCDAA
jgi:hypothetical protein